MSLLTGLGPASLGVRLRALLTTDAVKGRFSRGVFWSFVGTIITNAAGLAVAVITARVLGREGYGAVGILTSTYALFGQFSSLGLGLAAAKFVAEHRESNPGLAARSAGTCLAISWVSYGIAGVALVLAAPVLASRALADPGLATPLRLISVVLVLTGVTGVQTNILAGLEEFRGTARVLAWRALINLVLTPVGGLWYGIHGIVWAMILATGAQFAGTQWYLGSALRARRMTLSYRLERNEWNALLRVTVPAFLAWIFVVPSAWLVNVFVVNQPQGYAEMGVLNAAMQWRALATLVPTIFNTVVLVFQSNLYSTGARREFDQLALTNLAVQTLASGVVAAGICLAAPWIMAMFGRDFRGNEAVLVWLAASWVLIAPNSTLWNLYVSTGQLWRGCVFNLIGTGALVGLAWELRDRGALGIGMAYALSALLQTVLQGAHFAYWRSRHPVTVDPAADLAPARGPGRS